MDLAKLSVPELRDLLQKIPTELKKREAQDKVNVLNEARALAKAKGYSLEELLSKEPKVAKAKGTSVKVKYRHPNDASLQWTGRGRKPKWVEAWLSGGGKLDGLQV